MNSKLLTWALLLLWLVYLVSPFDLLPDFIAKPISYLDDFILGYFLWRWRNSLLRRSDSNSPEDEKTHQRSEQSSKQKGPGPKEERTLNPFEILGLEQGASRKDIERRYKELVQKYHPDKVNHLGEEFQQIAHEKMIEIQRAYSELTS